VPPGHQVNHSDVTWFMNLQYDAKLHYAAVHLHPFATELVLRDVTANKDVFVAKATNPMGAIGLTRVDRFSSAEGVLLYRSHKYEIVSVYDNPMHENADSMASVFLGLADPEFVKPAPTELARRSSVLFGSDRLALQTRAGAVTVTLARSSAPDTVIQVARLYDGGAFNGAGVINSADAIHINLPFNAETYRLLQPLTKETGLPHRAGTVSYCIPGAGSRQIVLSVARRDNMDVQCTAFGSIDGIDALAVSRTLSVASR